MGINVHVGYSYPFIKQSHQQSMNSIVLLSHGFNLKMVRNQDRLSSYKHVKTVPNSMVCMNVFSVHVAVLHVHPIGGMPINTSDRQY